MSEIVIDEKVRHGKPIVKGTRITVEEILGMLESGMNEKEIKKEYGLEKEDIRTAIKYARSFLEDREISSKA